MYRGTFEEYSVYLMEEELPFLTFCFFFLATAQCHGMGNSIYGE